MQMQTAPVRRILNLAHWGNVDLTVEAKMREIQSITEQSYEQLKSYRKLILNGFVSYDFSLELSRFIRFLKGLEEIELLLIPTIGITVTFDLQYLWHPQVFIDDFRSWPSTLQTIRRSGYVVNDPLFARLLRARAERRAAAPTVLVRKAPSVSKPVPPPSPSLPPPPPLESDEEPEESKNKSRKGKTSETIDLTEDRSQEMDMPEEIEEKVLVVPPPPIVVAPVRKTSISSPLALRNKASPSPESPIDSPRIPDWQSKPDLRFRGCPPPKAAELKRNRDWARGFISKMPISLTGIPESGMYLTGLAKRNNKALFQYHGPPLKPYCVDVRSVRQFPDIWEQFLTVFAKRCPQFRRWDESTRERWFGGGFLIKDARLDEIDVRNLAEISSSSYAAPSAAAAASASSSASSAASSMAPPAPPSKYKEIAFNILDLGASSELSEMQEKLDEWTDNGSVEDPIPVSQISDEWRRIQELEPDQRHLLFKMDAWTAAEPNTVVPDNFVGYQIRIGDDIVEPYRKQNPELYDSYLVADKEESYPNDQGLVIHVPKSPDRNPLTNPDRLMELVSNSPTFSTGEEKDHASWYARIKRWLRDVKFSFYKSLLQKTFRFHAVNVTPPAFNIDDEELYAESDEAALTVPIERFFTSEFLTVVLLVEMIKHKGSFNPEVSQVEHGMNALKRLSVIALEDAFIDNGRDLTHLIVISLLKRKVTRWYPSMDLLKRWISIASKIWTLGDKYVFHWDTEAKLDKKWKWSHEESPWHNAAALLMIHKSLKGDYVMFQRLADHVDRIVNERKDTSQKPVMKWRTKAAAAAEGVTSTESETDFEETSAEADFYERTTRRSFAQYHKWWTLTPKECETHFSINRDQSSARPATMPFTWALDQHTTPRVMHFMRPDFVRDHAGTKGSKPYGEVARILFENGTGLNHRRVANLEDSLKSEEVAIIKEAQNYYWRATFGGQWRVYKTYKYSEETREILQPLPFQYELHRSWLAGGVGPIKTKIKDSQGEVNDFWAIMIPAEIDQFSVIRAPSASKKKKKKSPAAAAAAASSASSARAKTDSKSKDGDDDLDIEEIKHPTMVSDVETMRCREAAMKQLQSKDGVPWKACPVPVPEWKNATVRYVPITSASAAASSASLAAADAKKNTWTYYVTYDVENNKKITKLWDEARVLRYSLNAYRRVSSPDEPFEGENVMDIDWIRVIRQPNNNGDDVEGLDADDDDDTQPIDNGDDDDMKIQIHRRKPNDVIEGFWDKLDYMLRDMYSVSPGSLRRLYMILNSKSKVIAVPNISRDGGRSGISEAVSIHDTLVFQTMMRLTQMCPCALQFVDTTGTGGDVSKFVSHIMPVRWQIAEVVRQCVKDFGLEATGKLKEIQGKWEVEKPTNPKQLYAHQDAALQALWTSYKRGAISNGIIMDTGSGKTEPIIRFAMWQIGETKERRTPIFIVHLIPSGAIKSIRNQWKAAGFATHVIRGLAADRKDSPGLIPFKVNIIAHDHVRLLSDIFTNEKLDTMFVVVDELHKMQNPTARSAEIFNVASNARFSSQVTATPNTDTHPEKMQPWLGLQNHFTVTDANFWNAYMTFYTFNYVYPHKQLHVDFISRLTVEEKKEYERVMPIAFGGTVENGKASVEGMRIGKSIITTVKTRGLVAAALRHLSDKEKKYPGVMIVVSTYAVRDKVARDLIKAGHAPETIIRLGSDGVTTLNPDESSKGSKGKKKKGATSAAAAAAATTAADSKTESKDDLSRTILVQQVDWTKETHDEEPKLKPTRILIAPLRFCEGYNATFVSVQVFSVEESNEATRRQMAGRILRLDQQAKEVLYVKVKDSIGYCDALSKRHELPAELNNILKTASK